MTINIEMPLIKRDFALAVENIKILVQQFIALVVLITTIGNISII